VRAKRATITFAIHLAGSPRNTGSRLLSTKPEIRETRAMPTSGRAPYLDSSPGRLRTFSSASPCPHLRPISGWPLAHHRLVVKELHHPRNPEFGLFEIKVEDDLSTNPPALTQNLSRLINRRSCRIMPVPPIRFSASFQALWRSRPRALASVHPASPVSHSGCHAGCPFPSLCAASWRILRIALWVSIFQNRFTVKFKVNSFVNFFSGRMESNSLLFFFCLTFAIFSSLFPNTRTYLASPHPAFNPPSRYPAKGLHPAPLAFSESFSISPSSIL
jgi:hypothetical protein